MITNHPDTVDMAVIRAASKVFGRVPPVPPKTPEETAAALYRVWRMETRRPLVSLVEFTAWAIGCWHDTGNISWPRVQDWVTDVNGNW